RSAAKSYYSITSSARSRNPSGRFSPRALAVVRLMMRSNLVGCSTGRSAGFAPRRILVHVFGGAPEHTREIWSIAHQTSGLDVFPKIVHRRQSRAECKGVDANPIGVKVCVRRDKECVCVVLQRLKGGHDILCSSDSECGGAKAS